MEPDPAVALASEFKDAATAVTRLYRLSMSKVEAARAAGHAAALRSLLDALDENPNLDVRTWALASLVNPLYYPGTVERNQDQEVDTETGTGKRQRTPSNSTKRARN